MMKNSLIELKNIVKQYNGNYIVKNLDLTIYENEFLTLLGPSGCGKTTTLRMIAGFEFPDSGDIIIDGKIVNNLPAFARPINTVFQRYALFPHLNVFDNVAYGIKNRNLEFKIKFFGGLEHIENLIKEETGKNKISQSNIRRKVKELTKVAVLNALKSVNLSGYENRKIDALSGGQMQRIAIARAIVLKQKILLLDEPLSALDLKLRQSMQYELKQMQRQLGITFIYVTHDQEEAMVMSDRIVIMNEGVIQQLATPKEIYDEPKNRFVAKFIGESNIIRGYYVEEDLITFLGYDFKCVNYSNQFEPGEVIDILIRPEDFVITTPDKGLVGDVIYSIFKGVHYELIIDVGCMKFKVHTYENIKVGSKVGLRIMPDKFSLMKVYENEK